MVKHKKNLQNGIHLTDKLSVVIVSEFVGAARFYKKHFKVLLLVIVIMTVLPITGYYLGGVLGVIISGSVCNVAAFLLGRRAAEELQQILQDINKKRVKVTKKGRLK